MHNPVTEACDDGNANEDDSCTAMCQINDLVAEPPTGAAGGPPGGGHLFGGRHPIAASAAGCAVALVDAQTYSLALAAFGPKGERLGVATGISESAHDTMIANPVLAALPDGTYAVAWTDFGADGDQSGVAVRRVDPMKGAVGAIFHANTTTEFSQSDVDILWTGTELVLAWVDTSDVATAPDLKIRRFGADLTAKAAEEVLAATADTEGSVALASFSGSWAAAWRTASDMEAISVTTASGISWSVGPYAPSSATDRPALVALDKAHLAVVFTAADDNLDAGVVGGGLRIAVLDVAHPGDSQAVDLPAGFVDPGVSGFADPAAAVVGSSVYVSWRSGVEPDFADARIWLREVAFSISASGVVSLDTSANAQLLPRQAQHSPGQSLPSLAASPLAPTGALATGWLDSNQTFANEGKSDVVFSFIPLPPLVKKTQIRIVGGGS